MKGFAPSASSASSRDWVRGWSGTAKGKRVTVVGFGTFLPRKRKARAGRSPINGKEIKITAKTLPAFAAGQGFKQAVDKT